MTLHHIADTIFRAGVYRAMHFAPLWLAIAIAGGAAIFMLRRRS